MSLKLLQEKIGAKPDGVFGKETLKLAKDFFKLSSLETAHFFGQIAHETGSFTIFEENLRYSATRLREVFPKYFPTIALAKEYSYKPERIASRVYANRMGNGDEASGDGWKYRGRGAIQLTGKTNYTKFSEHQKNPLILENPDLVSTVYAFESAKFFFDENFLWRICNQGMNRQTITLLTRRVNGGLNGLEDRITKSVKYYSLLQI